jgi:hypothetical protein
MRYRRVLLVSELGSDPASALAAARGLAPGAERLEVVCCPAARRRAPGPRTRTPDRLDAWLAAVRDAAASVASRAEVGVVADLGDGTLEAIVAPADVDLVIAGPAPLGAIPVLARLRKRHPVAVLWLAPGAAPRDRPIDELFCVALDSRAEASVAAFVRDHVDPVSHVTVLSFARPSARELAVALEVFGVRASVELCCRASRGPSSGTPAGLRRSSSFPLSCRAGRSCGGRSTCPLSSTTAASWASA